MELEALHIKSVRFASSFLRVFLSQFLPRRLFLSDDQSCEGPTEI
jgi:hypothetical protein